MLRDILEYFYRASAREIKKIENGVPVQSATSVNFFFDQVINMLNTDEAEFMRHKLFSTFLSGDQRKWEDMYRHDPDYDHPLDDASIDNLLSRFNHNLNTSQKEALKIAINEPISLIQGPPGTGKTHMILALLYVLTNGLEKSVAVVSVNNEAIQNITDEILENDHAKPHIQDLRPITAKLGNRTNKKAYNLRPDRDARFAFKVAPGEDGYLDDSADTEIEKKFREKYRIISSTPHCLMKLFTDSYSEEAMYDYVIVDETSQMNTMLGLISMFPAKHLVLVGDDKQIPPIVREDKYEGLSLHGRDNSIFLLKENRSFLKVVSTILQRDLEPVLRSSTGSLTGDNNRVLKTHYRCHPGIFEFCRRYFYSNDHMTIDGASQTGNICPMRFTYYRGSYTEKCYIGKAEWRKSGNNLRKIPFTYTGDIHEAGEQVSRSKKIYQDREGNWQEKKELRTSVRNMRQIQIFLTEEWPQICENIKQAHDNGESFSVCILSPYKAQIYELKERLFRLLSSSANAQDPDEFPVNTEWPLDHVIAKGNIDKDDWARFITITGPDLLAEDDDDPEEGDDEQRPDQGISALIIRDTKSLTIHSAQGQGFDKVYLMPVDDSADSFSAWEPPFSQQGHLINVAVSRAKKEFCLIASAELMSDEIKKSLNIAPDCAVPVPAAAANSNKRYVDLLIQYIYDAFFNYSKDPFFARPDAECEAKYGFHETKVHTLFEITDDEVCKWADSNGFELLTEGESGIARMSRDEARVAMFLEAAGSSLGFDFDPSDDKIGIFRQVPLNGNNLMPMDFALCDADGHVLCYIEEDGIIHRFRQRDRSGPADEESLNRLIDSIVDSYNVRDQKCRELELKLLRWCSDTSHMIKRDGVTPEERMHRENILNRTSAKQWDQSKSWRDQVDCFYEYNELEMILSGQSV